VTSYLTLTQSLYASNGGGSDGGYVLATGTPTEIKRNKKSIIGRYLS